MTRNEAREIMMQILYELDATKALDAEKAVSLAEELQALGCICSVQWVGRPRRIGSGSGPIPLESTPLAPYAAGGDY